MAVRKKLQSRWVSLPGPEDSAVWLHWWEDTWEEIILIMRAWGEKWVGDGGWGWGWGVRVSQSGTDTEH